MNPRNLSSKRAENPRQYLMKIGLHNLSSKQTKFFKMTVSKMKMIY